MKICLKCKKEFQEKRDSAKFCSTSCRVMWNRKHDTPQEKATELISQVLYRTVLNELNELKNIIKNNNIGIQDLTKPTHHITPITEIKSITNTVINTVQPQRQLSLLGSYKVELKECTTIPMIEAIIKIAKNDFGLSPREKLELEMFAKELSKEMYTD